MSQFAIQYSSYEMLKQVKKLLHVKIYNVKICNNEIVSKISKIIKDYSY